MDIKVLFPTLVGISHADQATINLINHEVLQQKDMLESFLSLSWGDNVMTSFNKEKNLFAAANLHALRKFVEDSVLEFVNTTRKNAKFRIDHNYTQSWVNITKKFGFQERHNHEKNTDGLLISGAYYLSTNGHDGNLAIFPVDMQYKLFENHEIEPEVGKLVLFGSEVFHRVSVNLTESERISFSFNYLLVE